MMNSPIKVCFCRLLVQESPALHLTIVNYGMLTISWHEVTIGLTGEACHSELLVKRIIWSRGIMAYTAGRSAYSYTTLLVRVFEATNSSENCRAGILSQFSHLHDQEYSVSTAAIMRWISQTRSITKPPCGAASSSLPRCTSPSRSSDACVPL
jgi:hypothetical protein